MSRGTPQQGACRFYLSKLPSVLCCPGPDPQVPVTLGGTNSAEIPGKGVLDPQYQMGTRGKKNNMTSPWDTLQTNPLMLGRE